MHAGRLLRATADLGWLDWSGSQLCDAHIPHRKNLGWRCGETGACTANRMSLVRMTAQFDCSNLFFSVLVRCGDEGGGSSTPHGSAAPGARASADHDQHRGGHAAERKHRRQLGRIQCVALSRGGSLSKRVRKPEQTRPQEPRQNSDKETDSKNPKN